MSGDVTGLEGSSGDARDDGVVEEIVDCLTQATPQSFFLFAGAGSGKTHTLKEALERLTGRVASHRNGTAYAARLRAQNRQIAVVTYTNNAVEEIQGRLESNPLVAVSTIHTFCWRLVAGFDEDIRAALLPGLREKLDAENAKRPETTTPAGKLRKPATYTKMLADWERKVGRLEKEIAGVMEAKRFTYSPDQERFGGGALSHDQVISTATWLLDNRRPLQRILVDRHPVVFIDESQDTEKRVLHALLDVEQNTRLCLGLIGDHRQRVYTTGEQSLHRNIPPSWRKPALKLNRRCPKRIVDLINKIWHAEVEGRTDVPVGEEQHALSTRPGGTVRLYLGDAGSAPEGKPDGERRCAKDMVREASDTAWAATDVDGSYKLLVLEHQLAADRGGFGTLYRHLHRYDDTRAKDGTIAPLSVVRNVLEPLSDATRSDGTVDAWLERDRLADHARALALHALAKLDGQGQREAFTLVSEGARKLRERWEAGDPTLAQLLTCARDSELLALDSALLEALTAEPPSGSLTGNTPKDELLAGALHCSWSEYRAYRKYVDGTATYGTHQGVKGSEFPRVLVVIDDSAAAGNQFAYEKIFGAKQPSKSDEDNKGAGKETSIDRTLRLLYVTCSRAQKSLAVVLWTSDMEAVKKQVTELGWFSEDEIRDVPSS